MKKLIFPARKIGALGLPTVKIIANDAESALNLMMKLGLTFMPTENYASKPVVFDISSEDNHAPT